MIARACSEGGATTLPVMRDAFAVSGDETPSIATRAVVLDEPPHDGERLDEAFFSEPYVADEVATDPRGEATRRAVREAFAAARRARFARLVSAATAVCAVVCVAAFGRSLVPGNDSHATVSSPSLAVAAQPPPAAVVPAELTAEATRQHATARAALERGDTDAAIDAAARSIAIDPSRAASWLLLGDAYERSGRPEDASKAFRQCIDSARVEAEGCVARLR